MDTELRTRAEHTLRSIDLVFHQGMNIAPAALEQHRRETQETLTALSAHVTDVPLKSKLQAAHDSIERVYAVTADSHRGLLTAVLIGAGSTIRRALAA